MMELCIQQQKALCHTEEKADRMRLRKKLRLYLFNVTHLLPLFYYEFNEQRAALRRDIEKTFISFN